MATIKYLLLSKTKNSQIYLRLSISRKQNYRRRTGLFINPTYWSNKKGYPITKDANSKNLNTQLKKLEGFILEQYHKDITTGISSNWLKNQIDIFFNRKPIENLDYFVNYFEFFIKNLPYKVTDKGKKGVTNSTLNKYKTIKNKIATFEAYRKKRILIKDIDINFRNELLKYFCEVQNINDNTAGRYIKFVKTICLDAQKRGIETNPQLRDFKGFSVKAQKITLSFDELEKIKNSPFKNDILEITKDWLIIACYTGQRISDFMRMSKRNIRQIRNFKFIDIEQQKTGKLVQIPIHQEIQTILDKRDGQFPPVYSLSKESNSIYFNKYLKTLCRHSGITEIIKGNKRGIKPAEYEKWELVTSHIGRRSFATNFYGNPKYPTPLLMNITGHSTEKMFLEYIGKKPIDYSLQLAEIWANEAPKENYSKTYLKVT